MPSLLRRQLTSLMRLPDLVLSRWRMTLIRVLLILSIIATVAAVAIKTYRGDGTALNAFLFLNLQWSNQDADRLESVCLAMVLAVTAVGVLRPVWYWLLPAAVWILVESILKTQVGGEAFYQLAPGAAALRCGAPLGTALLLSGYACGQSCRHLGFRSGALLLRIAVAIVFLSHGYEAWKHNAGFIDLIIGSAAKHLDVWLDEMQVVRWLSIIGAVDILVGLWLLLGSNRYVLVWACIWGLITTLSRMTSLGLGAYPEVLYRATHFIVPLALLLLIWNQSEDDAPKTDNLHEVCS